MNSFIVATWRKKDQNDSRVVADYFEDGDVVDIRTSISKARVGTEERHPLT